jgi:hypothetical protein
MDVTLHIGAHRTGSTSFQNYLRDNRVRLDGQSYGFWGPWRTRKGLLNDLGTRPASAKAAQRAAGRVQINLAATAKRGMRCLLVSDENMIGTPRRCLRNRALYSDIGERMARYHAAFQTPKRILLQIRSLDTWWPSVMAHLLPRGEDVPAAGTLEAITNSPRSWRHVIADLACACPDSEIIVTPFERFVSQPDRLFQAMTDAPVAPASRIEGFWHNRSPLLPALRDLLEDRGQAMDLLPEGDGRWNPFHPAQSAQLREMYEDDLFWLRAGADGLAKLTEDIGPSRPRLDLAAALHERGQRDDRPARKLAQTGRERTAWSRS